jgi:hypothetical protein
MALLIHQVAMVYGGWGVVLRDCNGDVLMAAAEHLPGFQDAPHAEAVAFDRDCKSSLKNGCGAGEGGN